MSHQQVLTINLILIIFFTIFFIMGRRSIVKNKMKLKVSPEEPKNVTNLPLKNKSTQKPRVMFAYNGHTWDAHEVLGIAIDANLSEIKIAFNQSLQKNSPESHDFFKVALAAIFQNMKDQGFNIAEEAGFGSVSDSDFDSELQQSKKKS